MNDFERQYYESEFFWKDTLQDPLNHQRVVTISDLVPESVKALLDVGCGNGIFLNYLNQVRPGIKTLGIDRSETALKYLKSEKKVGSIDDLPIPDKNYDCVTCLEVLEHLPVDTYEQALLQLSRVAREYLIISVPYNEDLEENSNQCPDCKSIFNFDLHLRSFDKTKMTKLFNNHGFSLMQLTTLGEIVYLKGHKTYSRFFYPGNYKVFRVPVCPVCGKKQPVVAENGAAPKVSSVSLKKRVLSTLTRIPKLIWPKGKRDYWILAVYKRNGQ